MTGLPSKVDRRAEVVAAELGTRAVLELTAEAHRTTNTALLRWIGLSPGLARAVSDADPGRLASLLARESIGIEIRVDASVLEQAVFNQSLEAIAENRIRALVDGGATHAMLNELGYTVSKWHFGRLCQTVAGTGFPTGRPAALDADDRAIRSMTTYWRSLRRPERIHPIDHLLHTARHLDVRVVSVWKYLQAQPGAIPPDVGGVPGWVFVMFPGWDTTTAVAP